MTYFFFFFSILSASLKKSCCFVCTHCTDNKSFEFLLKLKKNQSESDDHAVWSHKEGPLWCVRHSMSINHVTGHWRGKKTPLLQKLVSAVPSYWPGCSCWPWAPTRWPWWSVWGSRTPASPAGSHAAWTAPAGSPVSPGGSPRNLREREEQSEQRQRKREEVSQHGLKAHYESIIITAENERVH